MKRFILFGLLAMVTTVAMAQAVFKAPDSVFVPVPVPDDVWQRMQGKSYTANPYVGRDDLCYLSLLHWDQEGQEHRGELVCNKRIGQRLATIFRQLYEAHYAIERIQLPDDFNADDEAQMRQNNTSCFCYRNVAGTTSLSMHARGLAVDLNPLYNPYVGPLRADGSRRVQPATATPYVDRTAAFPYKIDEHDLAYRLFTEQGFSWGGRWRRSKDYQHFEFNE